VELQGCSPPRTQKKTSEVKPEIVQTQSWRYKIIVVTKRQQQTMHHIKQVFLLLCLLSYVADVSTQPVLLSLIKPSENLISLMVLL